ncbi:hypothetical protein FOG50_01697 [Hanseniaspora uvarum]|nr:hypothetical protein FOG50_01697 [Hanseniaspora uvarum]
MSAELDYSSSEESNKVENNATTTKKEYTQKYINNGSMLSMDSSNPNAIEVFKDGSVKDDHVKFPNTEDLLFDKKTNWKDHIGIILISLLISFGGFL